MSAPGSIEDIYPLSPMQQGILVHCLKAPGSGLYTLQMSWRLTGELDRPAFRSALARVVERHSVLRTSFVWEELDQPVQVVESTVPLPLGEEDWSGLDEAARRDRWQAFLADDLARGFDLSRAPLTRLLLAQDGPACHRLVWLTHMLLVDGWSMSELIGDLFVHYEACRERRDPLLPSPRRYRDYIAWLLEQDQGEAERHWRRELAGFAAPTPLPGDRGRRGLSHEKREETLLLSAEATAALQKLAREGRITPSTVFLGAWALLLARGADEDEVVFGVTVSGRPPELTGIEAVIGLFINTLPIRVRIAKEAPLLGWLHSLQEAQGEARLFEHTPLADIQGWSDVARGLPLFESVFVFENYPLESSAQAYRGSLAVDEVFVGEFSSYPLALQVAPGPRAYLRLTYDGARFQAEAAVCLLDRLRFLLEAMPGAAAGRLGDLPPVSPAELAVLLPGGGAAAPGGEAVLHELFAQEAAHHPEAVAVTCGTESLTYGELERRANRLAHHLRRLGVGPESLVGLVLDRTPEMIVGLLGILQAGGAYVPFDPDAPADRIAFAAEDAGMAALVTGGPLAGRLPPSLQLPLVRLDADRAALAGESDHPPDGGARPGNAAYVIYTSGSTGRPKGVVVPHAQAVRLFSATHSWLAAGAGDVWTLFHSVAFDFSVWEIWGALAHGGRLAIVPYRVSRDPASFYELLAREGVTVLNQTPSAFRQLVQAEGERVQPLPLALRFVIFGGEALEMASLAPWFERHGDERPRLVNMYGITETTVHVTWRPVSRADLGAGSLIGAPLPDLRLHLLQRDGHPAPLFAPGEIHVGGAGLARGYLNRPGLTAERFLPDPFADRPGARLYRSGDQARRLPAGSGPADLEVLGRIDEQVKIRGFRIEPGEISAALLGHPAVRDAAVVAREGGGGKRLVAYVVTAGDAPPAQELRAFLAARLPEPMIPAAFVRLPVLPLTRNGKLDRRALPEPGTGREGTARLSPPTTPTEQALAEVWADVLHLDRVGVDESFFTLGGDSILSLQVVSRAREKGLDLSLQQVFEHPTLRDLARQLEGAGAAAEVEEPGAPDLLGPEDRRRMPPGIADAYPLTRLQAGMLFHSELRPESAVYHDVFTAHFKGRLAEDRLRRAIERQLALHPVLRTSFDLTRFSEPMQLVHERVETPLAVIDLRHLPEVEQGAAIDAWLDGERHRSFDWAQPPLVRFQVHRRSEETFQLTVSFHHSVLDGWSLATLLTSLLRDAFGSEGAGEAPPAAFRELVVLERAAAASPAAREHWTRRLDGAAPLRLPRWPTAAGAPRRKHEIALPIDEAMTGGLRELAREAAVPLKSVLLALHVKVMGFLTGRTDVLTGLVSNGRPEREDADRALGLFLNTVPFRLRLGDESWLALAQRAFDLEREMLPHRRFPLPEILAATGGSPLFEVSFNFVHFHVYEGARSLGLTVLEGSGYEETDFTLGATFQLDLDGARLLLRLNFSNGEIGPEQGAAIGDAYRRALAAMTAEPRARHAAASLLAAEDLRRLVHEGSGPTVPLPQGVCLQDLFSTQAARTPEAVAVESEEGALSYGELERRAERLAGRLAGLGVGPEVPVGIALDRSPDMAIALLAVLKAGGACVPLDPEYPRERLALLLADAGPALVLTVRRLAAALPEGGARLFLDALPEREAAPAPCCRSRPAGLAVLLYTSGSTGRPKGVALTHRGLVNRMLWAQRAYPLNGDDRVLQSASFSFDFALWELFGPWLAGARAVLARPGGHRDSSYLAQLIGERRLTVAHFVPSMLRLFLEEDLAHCDGLRLVFSGGEALAADLRDRFFARLRAALHNQYGPTEASIDVTHRICRREDGGQPVPLGRPIDNTRIYLLDPAVHPVPPGVPGELCVGGENLARGYLHRPDLTAERFLPDPLSGLAGERLYRTGDLARHLPTGEIEFLGRIDHQIKVRGFRIEVEEVEREIARASGVREAAVAIRGDAAEARLVAWVVPGPAGSPSVAELREALRSRLPEFMVPNLWVTMPGLPRSPNGKIDRRALPDAGALHLVEASPQTWRSPTEELVARVWEDVLGLAQVGPGDDFFALGGHSLLATRVISRLRQALGFDLPLRALFEAPTVAQLAAAAEAARRAGAGIDLPPLAPAPRDGDLPLSFAQQRLWFLDQLEPGNPAYNIPSALRLTGDLRVDLLRATLAALVARHESLRTVFASVRGTPVQVIRAPFHPATGLVDLSSLPAARGEQEALWLVRHEAQRPFDLARGPLLRCFVLRLAAQEHVALLLLHHIVSDAWSTEVLVREVAALYGALLAGKPAPLPPLPVQYADFAVWQRSWLRGAALDAELGYWRACLEGAPGLLELPTDRPRPAVASAHGRNRLLHWPESLSGALRALARREGVTLFMVLLAGLSALLARLTGQDDVVVGAPIANRRRREVEGLIGFFVNSLALRTSLGDDPGFIALLRRVREGTLGAYAHQDIPFEKLVEELAPQRSLGHTPLFQVVLSLQNAATATLELPGLSLRPLQLEPGTTKFDLTLNLAEPGGEIAGQISYRTDLFDGATVERLIRHLQTLLEGAAGNPEERVSALPLASAAQRQQCLVEWNATAPGRPLAGCVHRLFEREAALHPEQPAVVLGDAVLTYGELNRRANRLARHLRDLGVGPERTVGIALETSPEMIIALWGVLKAGGAYLGLDPKLPPDRLRFMLEDSGVRVVVTQGGAQSRPVHQESVRVVSLEGEEAAAISRRSASDLEGGATEENLAYVIYTSGSTGRPKGVQGGHRQLLAYLSGILEVLEVEPGCSFALHQSLAVDAPVTYLFASLCRGGVLHLLQTEQVLDAELLRRSLATHPIDYFKTAPSHLGALLGTGGVALPRRLLMVGGEAFPRDLLERLEVPAGGCTVLNHYGPTETTVGVLTYAAGPAAAEAEGPATLPLGRPLAGARVVLLDRALRPVPPGTAGELYIGGPAVARGYLGRPALTAERFLPDPFGGDPGQRLYRTGDLARHLPDGKLLFLGRLDHQVKIRGFRVELGEVESVLGSHPGVAWAVAMVREDLPGDRRLVVYWVPELDAPAAEPDLWRHLRDNLPEHMLPGTLVALEDLPRTPQGKVDRRALPVPPAPATGGADAGDARTPVEQSLERLWAQMLGRQRVGVEESFFELGGHSLLATQVMSRVRRLFGVELPLRVLFETPTVAALARAVEGARRAGRSMEAPPLVPVPRHGPLPLSFSQQQLWVLDQMEPGRAHYNIPFAVKLGGLLHPAALAAALGEIARRHETLRTTFAILEGEPVQVIRPPAAVPLSLADLSALPPEPRRSEARRLALAEAKTPFDLGRGPLLRATLLRLAAEEHLVLLTLHHIVSDGWSSGILVRELAALYCALAQGEPAQLPELPVQYADFAVWQRRWLEGEPLDAQLAYWRRQLAALPVLHLPTDRPRPPFQTFRGRRRPVELPAETVRALRELAVQEGTTLFVPLLSGLAALCHQISGQDDIPIGTDVANRTRQEVEGLIGFFVNQLVMRVDLAGDPTFRELLRRTKEMTLAAWTHQDLPFERLVALQPERDPSRSPLFQVKLVLQNNTAEPLKLPGLGLGVLDLDIGSAKYDLLLNLLDGEGGVQGTLEHSADLFEADTVERWLDRFHRILQGAATRPDDRLSAILATAQPAIPIRRSARWNRS